MSLDHEARKKTLGASEIAAILGLNEWMSPLDVWQVKTGRKPPFGGNEHTRRGQRQERQILEWLGEEIPAFEIVTTCGGFVCKDWEVASATPDALAIPKEIAREILNHPLGSARIKAGMERANWDCCEAKSTLKTVNDITEVPHFWLQCQWQMMCCGLRKCHLALFGPMVSNYQRFEITYAEEYMKGILKDAQEWWEKHIVNDEMPAPINEEDVLSLWPQDDGTSIVAVDSLYNAIRQYGEYGAMVKDLKAKMEPLRERIVLAIGRAQTVRYGSRVIASYKSDKRDIRSLRVY